MMNIYAFRSMKDFWNKQTSGCMGPKATRGGNYFLEARELMMFLEPGKKYSTLELGCGSGELYSEMSEFYSSYIGVDFSASNLGIFKKKHPEVNLICSDILEFNTEQKFTLIHSNHLVQCLSLHQIEQMQKKLLELCLPECIIIHRGFLDRRLKSLYFRGYLYPGIHRCLLSRIFYPTAYRALVFFNIITGTLNALGFWHTREEILDLHKRLGVAVEIYSSPVHPNRFNIVVRR